MKASLGFAASFAFGILGVLTGVGLARLSHGPGAPAGPADAADLERLENRLAAAEGRLAGVAKLEAEVEGLRKGKAESLPASDDASVAAPAALAVDDAAGAVDQDEAPAPTTKLERWLETQGMRKDFEGLVSSVYEQSRDKRRQKEREDAEAREREMKELSEGPYGPFNYKVNSLAKTLELDARQKDYLYQLLTKYDEKRRDAKGQLRAPDGGELSPEDLQHHMKQFIAVQQQLGQQFDNDLFLGLNAAQQEAYKGLPEDQRGLNGNARMVLGDAVKVFAAGGGAAGEPAVRMLEKLTFTEKARAPPK